MEKGLDLRQLNIHPARRVLSIIEHGMVVQLEAGLHTIVVVEFDEGETAAFGGGFFLGCDADLRGGILLKVLGEGLVVCRVGQVS